MNDYLLSLLLGIIEGLTEFLPVSSTAHLRIAERLLHLSLSDGYWKMYSIVIQLGAILCLPVYFRARIAKFLSTFPGGDRGDRTVLTHPLGLTTIGFGFSAYLTYREAASIHAYCEWCLSSAVILTILFGCAIARFLIGSPQTPDRLLDDDGPSPESEPQETVVSRA